MFVDGMGQTATHTQTITGTGGLLESYPAGACTLRYRQSSLYPPLPYVGSSACRHAAGGVVALKVVVFQTASCGATNRSSSTAGCQRPCLSAPLAAPSTLSPSGMLSWPGV
jgi:hypothetical protein